MPNASYVNEEKYNYQKIRLLLSSVLSSSIYSCITEFNFGTFGKSHLRSRETESLNRRVILYFQDDTTSHDVPKCVTVTRCTIFREADRSRERSLITRYKVHGGKIVYRNDFIAPDVDSLKRS